MDVRVNDSKNFNDVENERDVKVAKPSRKQPRKLSEL